MANDLQKAVHLLAVHLLAIHLVFQTIAKITSKFFLIFHKKKLVYSITYYRQAFLLMKSFH